MRTPDTPTTYTDMTRTYIFYGCLSVLLIGLLYLGYNLFQLVTPLHLGNQTISLPNLQSQIVQAQAEQELYQAKLNKVKKVDNFVRYDHAKYLTQKVEFFNRYTNTRNLTTIYERLQELSASSQLMLSSFVIKNDSIQIKGQVADMQVMYGSTQKPGLIKKFGALKFLENIDIPYYKKNGDMFEFTLVATIKNATQSGNSKSP